MPLSRWQYFTKTMYQNAAEKSQFVYNKVIYEKDEDDPVVPTSQAYEIHMVSIGTSSTGSNNILFSTYSNGDKNGQRLTISG